MEGAARGPGTGGGGGGRLAFGFGGGFEALAAGFEESEPESEDFELSEPSLEELESEGLPLAPDFFLP